LLASLVGHLLLKNDFVTLLTQGVVFTRSGRSFAFGKLLSVSHLLQRSRRSKDRGALGVWLSEVGFRT